MSELPTHADRARVHAVLDAIWLQAVATGGYPPGRRRHLRGARARDVQRIARERVYAWLAEQMWLTPQECHVTCFTLDQCDSAIRHLSGVTYAEIRAWAHRRQYRTAAQARLSAAARECVAR